MNCGADIEEKKVLLLEPNGFMQDALRRALESCGMFVTCVRSPSDGYSMLKEDVFDAVVVDQDLPDKTGLEFIQSLDRNKDKPGRILMTTYGEHEVVEEVKKGALCDVIEKPFAFEELLQMIDSQENRCEGCQEPVIKLKPRRMRYASAA